MLFAASHNVIARSDLLKVVFTDAFGEGDVETPRPFDRHANAHFRASAGSHEKNFMAAKLRNRFIKEGADPCRPVWHSERLPTTQRGAIRTRTTTYVNVGSLTAPDKIVAESFLKHSFTKLYSHTSAPLKCARPVRPRVAGIGTPSFGSAAA